MSQNEYALLKAIEAIESLIPPQASTDPKHDLRWIALFELHGLNTEALRRAKYLENEAILSRLAAQKAYVTSKIRLELLGEDLGIEYGEEDDE